MLICIAVLAAVIASASHLPASQHTQTPPGMTHEEHMKQLEKEAELKNRGAAAMGFDQNAARHQFRIEPDGGSIAVDAKDRADLTTRDAIRAHLKQIADAFSKGDFSKPFQTHNEEPPGAPVMTERKDLITYTYADTPRGAIVRIRTRDVQARNAIHAFLTYQIREHGIPNSQPPTPNLQPPTSNLQPPVTRVVESHVRSLRRVRRVPREPIGTVLSALCVLCVRPYVTVRNRREGFNSRTCLSLT